MAPLGFPRAGWGHAVVACLECLHGLCPGPTGQCLQGTGSEQQGHSSHLFCGAWGCQEKGCPRALASPLLPWTGRGHGGKGALSQADGTNDRSRVVHLTHRARVSLGAVEGLRRG